MSAMILEHSGLLEALADAVSGLQQVRKNYQPAVSAEEVGIVRSLVNGVAWIDGLSAAGMEEILLFPGNVRGIVFDIGEEQTGVVLLDNPAALEAGDEVHRTGRVADVPVGPAVLGRVIDPGGRTLDGKGPLQTGLRLPIERNAPPILDRAPVKMPLQTGIKVIDAMIPIGRGQRQLIIGDRQTGKAAIAIDAILNQQNQGVICVYCAVGQRGAAVAKTVAELTKQGALTYTTVIIAEGSDTPGMRYIAPYAATAIAEYFMEQGRDVLIVYDDLTNHANAYREISLLLRRPPGREAFPGDIFYLHSRLLERATHLNEEHGGGSLTALPIIQTEAQNIAAYIPTNLISITDGQLYLSPDLFQKGILPAVDIGKSVSRVGGKAQLAAYHRITGNLKLAYAQFEELEMFSRFGTRLDEHTRATLAHGQRIRACLMQARGELLDVCAQILLLLALTEGLFDPVPLENMVRIQLQVIEAAAAIPPEIKAEITAGNILATADQQALLTLVKNSLLHSEVLHDTNARDFTA